MKFRPPDFYSLFPIQVQAMIEFLLTFVFLLMMVLAMSVGVLYGRKPISGSCGGLSNVGVDGVCELCGGKPENCDSLEGAEEGKDNSRSAGFYDASPK